MEIFNGVFSFDWRLAAVDFLRVALAFALAIPIGWERHASRRNMGLRTFPTVAMAACGFMLILKDTSGTNPELQARLIQGLISGIGFIGGGAILKHGTNVRGLATAASIWCTGAIGAAVAFQRIEIAVILSLITFLSLQLLTPLAHNSDDDGGGRNNDGKDR